MVGAGCVKILDKSRVPAPKCVVLYVTMGRLMDDIDFGIVAAVARACG